MNCSGQRKKEMNNRKGQKHKLYTETMRSSNKKVSVLKQQDTVTTCTTHFIRWLIQTASQNEKKDILGYKGERTAITAEKI